MRRGRCARRAMLGAVAAGALLGAARGYEIDLIAGETGRGDDEYKVVTTAGLEIVIGPKDGNEYDIASAVPSPNNNNLAVGIAVVGGKNDDALAIIPSNCPGGITLDASTGNIACYGVARGPEDESVEVTAGVIAVTGGVNVFADPSDDTSGGAFDWTNGCAGDIDVKITGEIVCFDVTDNVFVTNTDPGANRIFTVSGKDSEGEDVDVDVDADCPGGITIPTTGPVVCYDVARGNALVTNTAVGDDSGSIVVTEQTSQEKTTIAGGTIDSSATITVTGGDALASEGTNYKIELDTGDGAFTETVTVDDGAGTDDVTVTVTKVPDDGSVTKTVTVSDSGVPQSRTTTVTAPDANADADIVDVTVTVTEETAVPTGSGNTITYFPGTVTAEDKTKTVTTTTSEDANGVKTDTVTTVVTETDLLPSSTAPQTVTNTEEVTVTVTAPNAAIDGLFDDIAAPADTFPDSFAENTVITIVRKSADDSAGGNLKLETVVVTTELTESGTTTVTDYNIDYSENDDGILGFIKEIKTEDESVTTTFFLTGDASLPDPDGGEIDVPAGKYLDLFEEELSSSLTVATYRNRLPAGGKLPESFKDDEGEIKGEAILKFEIEGTSVATLFDDPSRLALTANLTTQVSGGTSRKLLQQEGVTQKETEFRSQIDDDDNIEESLKEVEKDANGNVIRFSANETKIEVGETGVVTVTEIETVTGDTPDQVVTVNELVLTEIGGSITVVSNKTTVDGQETFCDPPFAIVCGGSGSAPAPSPDNGGGGGGGPAPVPSPDNGS